jgi:phage I-like protein
VAYRASYLVDLSGLEFSDGPTWIQAMPLGTYNHPVHGEIQITPERILQFASNVKANVRGQDLDIDYDHKAQRSDASGWVKDAEARADGLWLFVDWTKEALAKLKEKAYRYFSPEFMDEWENPADKKKYKDVLFGGALTNRPFLKGILPINLSEAFDDVNKQTQEGVGSMNPKKLRLMLGLPEDATDEQVNAALEAWEPPKEEPKKDEDESGGGPGSGGTGTPEAIAASEELKKLTEANPVVKSLVDAINAQGATIAAQGQALVEAGVTKRLSEFDSDKRKLTPAGRKLLQEVLTEAPQPISDKLYQFLEKLGKGEVVVELGEKVIERSKPNQLDETSATARFQAAVKKLREDDETMDYATAANRVSQDQPDLFEEYRTEATSFATTD